MKHVYTFAGACVIATLVACAGTSSNNNSGGASNTPTGTVRIEAAIVPNPTTPPIDQIGPSNCPFTYTLVDPTNIEAGDSWQFILVSYDANGARTVLTNATGFSSSDTSNLYGSLTYDRGIFTATGAQTQTPQTVTVTYNGTSYFAQYSVLPHQARVRGQLIAHDTRKPIAGVEIDFYGPNSLTDSSIVIRGKAITQADGTFQASVPADTVVGSTTFSPTQFMQINNSTVPAAFQRYFEYNSSIYQTGILTCLAPLELPGTTQPMPLSSGNDDLLGVTQCSLGPIQPTNGWLLLYSNKETTPSPTGCSG